MSYKIDWGKMWLGHKFYPKHFKTKREEFMYRLKNKIHTSKSLAVLLDRFPQHKYKYEILAELQRRNHASKI